MRDGAFVRAVALARERLGAGGKRAVCAGALLSWWRARGVGVRAPLRRALEWFGVDVARAERAAEAFGHLRGAAAEPDFPGRVRQALVEDTAEQSRQGLYYTPWRVAAAMADLVRREAAPGPIVDPAAGAGVFGLALADLGDRVWLVEREPIGATIAAACSLAESARRGLTSPRVWRADALKGDRARDVTAELSGDRSRALDLRGPFGAVVGNPPYGPAAISGRPDAAYGRPPNIAAVFTLDYLERVANGGVLAFLLPRSVEFVEGWAAFRRALSDASEPLGVCPLGREIDVGMEQTVVALARRARPRQRGLCVLRLDGERFRPEYDVPATALGPPGGPIAWFLSPACRRLLAKIEARSRPLATLRPRICRGVTVQSHLGSHDGRWITRAEIERFRVTGARALRSDAPPNLARRAQSLRRPKIVAQRRVARRVGPPPRIVLKAAYDPDGRFDPADTVVNVLLDDRRDALLVLAVINTSLAGYYLLARAFNGNASTTPDLDRAYLDRLFVPDLPAGDRERLVRLAAQATEAALGGEEADPSAEIDELLAHRLGITAAERAMCDGQPPA